MASNGNGGVFSASGILPGSYFTPSVSLDPGSRTQRIVTG